jgi:hypothetical protein
MLKALILRIIGFVCTPGPLARRSRPPPRGQAWPCPARRIGFVYTTGGNAARPCWLCLYDRPPGDWLCFAHCSAATSLAGWAVPPFARRSNWLCFAHLALRPSHLEHSIHYLQILHSSRVWLCFAERLVTTETRRARRMQQDRNNRRLRDLCVSVVHSSAGWPPVEFAIHLPIHDIMTIVAVKGNPGSPEIFLWGRRLWQVPLPVGDLSPRPWPRDVCLAIRWHPWYSVGVERKRNSQHQGPVFSRQRLFHVEATTGTDGKGIAQRRKDRQG